MNCLKTHPNLLIKHNQSRREYNYSCLDIIKEYDLNPIIYYNYLLSIEEFKLRNIWNHMIKKWNTMENDLQDKVDFIKSDYSKNEYHYIHINMSDEMLNKLIMDFINENYVKCFFFCNTIINYITA